MTKITNELLEDYAMLYPRIKCCMMSHGRLSDSLDAITHPFDNIEYIQLRSIESITDEEELEVASIQNETVEHIRDYYTIEDLCGEAYDYIRSIGIATPFRGITVDELVESGKLKLI